MPPKRKETVLRKVMGGVRNATLDFVKPEGGIEVQQVSAPRPSNTKPSLVPSIMFRCRYRYKRLRALYQSQVAMVKRYRKKLREHMTVDLDKTQSGGLTEFVKKLTSEDVERVLDEDTEEGSDQKDREAKKAASLKAFQEDQERNRKCHSSHHPSSRRTPERQRMSSRLQWISLLTTTTCKMLKEALRPVHVVCSKSSIFYPFRD